MNAQPALIAALALAGAVVLLRGSQPRGLRLNNPGNLERVPGTTWEGQAARQPDPRFVAFRTLTDGARAMARVLGNYARVHGINTLRDIVNRYAPPPENDTDGYVRALAQRTGYGPEQPINLTHPPTLERVMAAMVVQEQGQAIPPAVIRAGVQRAWA